MTEEERETFEDHLVDEINALEQRILELEATTQPIAPDKGLGRLTRLEAMQDQKVKEAALAEARARLSRLELAMEQVFRPEFGKCKGCGRDIPYARLMAVPEATLCVSCAEG